MFLAGLLKLLNDFDSTFLLFYDVNNDGKLDKNYLRQFHISENFVLNMKFMSNNSGILF